MIKHFQFYYDEQLKHKVGEKLKFKELVVYAGETVSKLLFVKNLTRHELIQVRFFCRDKDVSFMPKLMDFQIGEVKEILVIYKPKLTRKKPLETIIKIEAKEKVMMKRFNIR